MTNKKRFHYHVTALENVDQIKKHGLKANEEGMIFLFTDMVVADTIARDQCFLGNKYAAFIIDSKGITGKITKDNVAEFSKGFHRILYQDKISPKYVSFLASLIVDNENPSEWDLTIIKVLHGLKGKAAKDFWYEQRKQILEFVEKQNGGNYGKEKT